MLIRGHGEGSFIAWTSLYRTAMRELERVGGVGGWEFSLLGPPYSGQQWGHWGGPWSGGFWGALLGPPFLGSNEGLGDGH